MAGPAESDPQPGTLNHGLLSKYRNPHLARAGKTHAQISITQMSKQEGTGERCCRESRYKKTGDGKGSGDRCQEVGRAARRCQNNTGSR